MPTFIKRYFDDDTGEYLPYTDEELKDIHANNPGQFFDVPESHASQVLRPSGAYQEVGKHILSSPVPRHATSNRTERHGSTPKAR